MTSPFQITDISSPAGPRVFVITCAARYEIESITQGDDSTEIDLMAEPDNSSQMDTIHFVGLGDEWTVSCVHSGSHTIVCTFWIPEWVAGEQLEQDIDYLSSGERLFICEPDRPTL